MSIPKEPRQQMTNIMYLVLIAMLAMNVSAEILNAFKIVDRGINNSNTAIDGKTAITMESFKKQIEKNKNGIPYYDVAQKVAPITDEFVTYIDNLRNDLIQASGVDAETGDKDYGGLAKLDDQDGPTRILVEGEGGQPGKAYELEQKIDGARQKYIDLVKELLSNPAADAKAVEADVKFLEDNIPLVTPDPPAGSEKKDWATYNFNQVPVLPALTLINQFKNNAISSEAMVIDRLFSHVGEKIEIFDVLKAAVVPKTGTSLLQGETFEADIYVAATSSKANPSIVANGRALPVVDGIATYKAPATDIGKKSLQGSISVKDGYGNVKNIPYNLDYQVFSRPDHVAVVSADAMNVFYIGVDNPVSASMTGIREDDTNVSMTGGTINKASGKGAYTVRVTNPGDASVSVSAKAKDGSPVTGTKKFRVKRIPDPTPKVGAKAGGAMGTGEWKAQPGVRADLADFVFDAKFSVLGFEMTLSERGQDLQTCSNGGAAFSGNCATLVGRAKVGSIYYIDNIKAKGPDGVTRTLPTIAFKII